MTATTLFTLPPAVIWQLLQLMGCRVRSDADQTQYVVQIPETDYSRQFLVRDGAGNIEGIVKGVSLEKGKALVEVINPQPGQQPLIWYQPFFLTILKRPITQVEPSRPLIPDTQYLYWLENLTFCRIKTSEKPQTIQFQDQTTAPLRSLTLLEKYADRVGSVLAGRLNKDQPEVLVRFDDGTAVWLHAVFCLPLIRLQPDDTDNAPFWNQPIGYLDELHKEPCHSCRGYNHQVVSPAQGVRCFDCGFCWKSGHPSQGYRPMLVSELFPVQYFLEQGDSELTSLIATDFDPSGEPLRWAIIKGISCFNKQSGAFERDPFLLSISNKDSHDPLVATYRFDTAQKALDSFQQLTHYYRSDKSTASVAPLRDGQEL